MHRHEVSSGNDRLLPRRRGRRAVPRPRGRHRRRDRRHRGARRRNGRRDDPQARLGASARPAPHQEDAGPTRDAVREIVDGRVDLEGRGPFTREVFPERDRAAVRHDLRPVARGDRGGRVRARPLTAVRDYQQARVAIDQNDVTKRLTAIASIVLIPTFVVGLYGQNFDHMPETTGGWVRVLVGGDPGQHDPPGRLLPPQGLASTAGVLLVSNGISSRPGLLSATRGGVATIDSDAMVHLPELQAQVGRHRRGRRLLEEASACRRCGFGFLFELLDDYYPSPTTGFVVCDAEGRILALGRGVFELTGYQERTSSGRK